MVSTILYHFNTVPILPVLTCTIMKNEILKQKQKK